MLYFVQGDMFLGNHEVLVNPINARGIAGKGVALQFKNNYPDWFTKYKEVCDKNVLMAGDIWVYHTGLNYPKYIKTEFNNAIYFVNDSFIGLKKSILYKFIDETILLYSDVYNDSFVFSTSFLDLSISTMSASPYSYFPSMKVMVSDVLL